ncbi:hypothetical protein, partial [Citrobacter freundii]
LMMSLWDALRMNMMISYQELVRTFLSAKLSKIQTLIVLPNAARNKKKSNKKQIKLGRLTCCNPLFLI